MIVKPKRVEEFRAWLLARGALLLEPGEFEIARFKTGNTTCSVYTTGRKAKLQFNCPAAASAWAAFDQGMRWRAPVVTPYERANKTLRQRVRERDGGLCFFCRLPVAPGPNESLEHLVARSARGPQHIDNMYLAHAKPCNIEAGHLSAPEKVQLAINNALRLELQRLGFNLDEPALKRA